MLASPAYEAAFKALEFHLAIPGIHVDPASDSVTVATACVTYLETMGGFPGARCPGRE